MSGASCVCLVGVIMGFQLIESYRHTHEFSAGAHVGGSFIKQVEGTAPRASSVLVVRNWIEACKKRSYIFSIFFLLFFIYSIGYQ